MICKHCVSDEGCNCEEEIQVECYLEQERLMMEDELRSGE